ncbi:MAG: hypothetical protein OXC03_04065 [Flavobacteriaceae bacterium]|nr:hypothetical protein [Flavobacteriaceae bacterium]
MKNPIAPSKTDGIDEWNSKAPDELQITPFDDLLKKDFGEIGSETRNAFELKIVADILKDEINRVMNLKDGLISPNSPHKKELYKILNQTRKDLNSIIIKMSSILDKDDANEVDVCNAENPRTTLL